MYAFNRKERYPNLCQCFVGGLFIGVPFRGTIFANFGLMYASVADLWGDQFYTTLLEFMKETDAEDSGLNKLRDELRRVESHFYPRLEFRCIFETAKTDFEGLRNIHWIRRIYGRFPKLKEKVSVSGRQA